MPANSVPDKDPLTGLKMDATLLYPPVMERGIIPLVSLLIRALISFMKAPPSGLNYLPKTLLPDIITLRIMASIYKFWGNTSFHSSIAEIREYNLY